MRPIITLSIAALILAGSYVIAFGVPASLRPVFGIEADSGQGSGATAARPSPDSPTGKPSASRATTVVLAPLEMQPYADILRAVGSASALRSAEVIADVSGEVTEINLSSNRQVSAGEMLVQLDARTEVFNREIAQAELDQARDTVERYERLQGTGSSTITDVALSEAKVAERLAEANVGLADAALDDRTIRAPISGKLSLSDVEVGDRLSVGSVVVTIDDSEALLIEFELPERSIGLLSKEQTILASTPTFTGQVFEGGIVSFDSRIDSVTRSVTVKARIENPDGLLWPGMTFSVRIIHESDPLAVLPSTAITWSRSGSSVWIDEDGVAKQIPATILFRRNDQVWIDADISTGTLVVTEGAQKLRPGARIAAANDPAQRSPVANPAGKAPEVGQAEPKLSPATEEPT